MDKKLLTIQDISCFGQCSLTVALPVISACGIETVILPSAVLSTHTAGFKNYTFRDLTGDIPGIEKSWLENGLKFDAFYTGYVCENQIQVILDLMKSCAAPGALRIVDPVMADNGKIMVSDQITKSEVASMTGISIKLRATVVQSGGFENPIAAWDTVSAKEG